jgi:hypothetical protein
MIQAIKDFMNVAGEAMEKAESAVKDASKKVQDAKKDTCEAIGKVCDVAKTCKLRSIPLIGGWLCKAWEFIVDAVCSLACSIAKGVLDIASAVLDFVAAVISVAKDVMEGILDFLTSVLDAVFPVKLFEVNFQGKADYSLRRQTSVAVDVSLTVRDYYETLKCAPSFRSNCLKGLEGNKVWYDPWTFGFNFDFTSLLSTFKAMVADIVEKMMGGKEDTPNPKAAKFRSFITKKTTPPPDVMSADFQPFICKYSPNDDQASRKKIYKCKATYKDREGNEHNQFDQDIQTCQHKEVDYPQMTRTYLCDDTKDCVQYNAMGNKNLACASKSSV